MSEDHIKYVTVKRQAKKKSGYSVEERDGEYFVSEAPAKARVNVGDKVVTINGIHDGEFTDEDDANGLIESIRIVVIPADEIDEYDAAVNAEDEEEEEEEESDEDYEESDRRGNGKPNGKSNSKPANGKGGKKKKGGDSDEDSDHGESDKRGKSKGRGKKGAAAAAAIAAAAAAAAAQYSDDEDSDEDEEAPENHALVVREKVSQFFYLNFICLL
jgi:hypothetical protein